MKYLYALLLVAIVSSCDQPYSVKNDQDLQKLKGWMTGSFSSQEQSVADTNFYDIRLHMTPIWEERDDAIWLYVEQAASWNLEKPYRQRVYRLTRSENDQIESAVYTISNPLQYTGAHQNKSLLNNLHPDSISMKDGCSIYLTLDKNAFMGSTDNQACPSQLRGARYATSEVTIKADVLESLDRGYDGEGNQVWGSEYGAYIFRKKM